MSDTVDGSSAHLAAAAKAVTKAVEAAWLVQQKMGEGIGPEVRDALIALVTERSPRAKVRMISERPELTDNAAERLIDHAIALVRALPAADALRPVLRVTPGIHQASPDWRDEPGDVPAEPLPDAAARRSSPIDGHLGRNVHATTTNEHVCFVSAGRLRTLRPNSPRRFAGLARRGRGHGRQRGTWALHLDDAHRAPSSRQSSADAGACTPRGRGIPPSR